MGLSFQISNKIRLYKKVNTKILSNYLDARRTRLLAELQGKYDKLFYLLLLYFSNAFFFKQFYEYLLQHDKFPFSCLNTKIYIQRKYYFFHLTLWIYF